MKKTLLVCAMAMMGSFAFGQINSGSIFLTGMGSISTQGGETESVGGPTTVTTEADKNFSGTFGLGGGYFLSENIAIGVGFTLTGSKMTPSDTSNPEATSSGMGVGVFGRYYVPMGERFYFFGNAGVNFGSGSSKTIKDGVETEGPKLSNYSIGISPGFTFFPTEKFAMDMTWGFLGYSANQSEFVTGPITTTVKSSGMNVNFNLATVGFGIHYFLR